MDHLVGAQAVAVLERAAVEVGVAEDDATRVLHRAGVELGDENLVVLAKGVGEAEVAVVEIKALLGLREQALSIQCVGERSAAVDAEWHLELLGRLALWVCG